MIKSANKVVFISFTHKLENEEYQVNDAKRVILEYVRAGFPIRYYFYDREENVLFVHFGSKGSVIENG